MIGNFEFLQYKKNVSSNDRNFFTFFSTRKLKGQDNLESHDPNILHVRFSGPIPILDTP